MNQSLIYVNKIYNNRYTFGFNKIKWYESKIIELDLSKYNNKNIIKNSDGYFNTSNCIINVNNRTIDDILEELIKKTTDTKILKDLKNETVTEYIYEIGDLIVNKNSDGDEIFILPAKIRR